MTLEQWALVSQIAVAVFTLAGVLIALYVALKSLREEMDPIVWTA